VKRQLGITAIVLAGGFSKKFFEAFKQGYKALLHYGGKAMWEIADQAAAGAGIYDRIIVGEWIQKTEAAIRNDGWRMMRPGYGSLYRNLREMLLRADSEYVVILTADIYRITGEILDRFLELCYQTGDVGLACPVIPVELCELEHPGAKRTSVKLVEGKFTLGNVFFANREVLLANLWKIGIFLWARKKPLVLALILGPKFVWGYLHESISLTDLEAKAQKMLGVKVHAIVCKQPGDSALGDDVDKPEQADNLDEAKALSDSIPVV